MLMLPISLSLLGLCAGALAASPPDDNPDYIYDPFNSTSHGLIFSPSRIVLKVDCPGCPIYDKSWHTEATSLVIPLAAPVSSILFQRRILH